jgi:hypothetical protein
MSGRVVRGSGQSVRLKSDQRSRVHRRGESPDSVGSNELVGAESEDRCRRGVVTMDQDKVGFEKVAYVLYDALEIQADHVGEFVYIFFLSVN